jgi:hypothetical protein
MSSQNYSLILVVVSRVRVTYAVIFQELWFREQRNMAHKKYLTGRGGI